MYGFIHSVACVFVGFWDGVGVGFGWGTWSRDVYCGVLAWVEVGKEMAGCWSSWVGSSFGRMSWLGLWAELVGVVRAPHSCKASRSKKQSRGSRRRLTSD